MPSTRLRPEPLCPAKGVSAPRAASEASVVGWPSGPRATPSGMGSPRAREVITLPKEMAVVAKSMRTGSSPAGTAMASGFVPNKRSIPP